MKRSEMVQKLKGYIFSLPTDTESGAEYLASLVIELCEEAGMKPPKNPTLLSNDWGMVANTFQWESE